nr:MAG TPA: putative tail component [Caudoviricetes sp.]
MSKNILPGDFSSEINSILAEYGDHASKCLVEVIPDVAKNATKQLKAANVYKRKTGRYNKGWTASTDVRRTEVKSVVHNRTDYQLSHLLEFGHAKANGGRTKAFPHIAQVNDWVQEELVKKIKERVNV